MNIQSLTERYAMLEVCAPDIENALQVLITRCKAGGKLLLCGNGGSAADCDHIVGELMKGFLKSRPLNDDDRSRLCAAGGQNLAGVLQYGIPAISLCAHSAVLSAFANDVAPEAVYAQLMFAYANKTDTAICLSTSGNSENVVNAAIAAAAKGVFVISMTGERPSRLSQVSDITIKVPETETFKVQELHLPVYHYLCAALEEALFPSC